MFNFLKDKIKKVVSAITRKVEETQIEDEESITKEKITKTTEKTEHLKTEKIIPKKEKIESPIINEEANIPDPAKETEEALKKYVPKQKKEKQISKVETIIDSESVVESLSPALDTNIEKEEEKPGFFERLFKPKKEEQKVPAKGIIETIAEKITTTKLSEDRFEGLFWDLETAMLENNVAVEVIDKIKQEMKIGLVDVPIKRGDVEAKITLGLKSSIESLFQIPQIDLIEKARQKKPYVIIFAGINGSGKTTTIAKVANMLKENNLTVVMAAGDTFRAAAIQQLETHATNLGVKLIKHNYGSDSAAVAFDAIKYAQANNVDVVLIDTAGRLHSNVNLMDEMKKIIRVSNPDLKIFIGESITGNDCVEQAKQFDYAIGIDGIILSKADVDEKGGAAISVSYVTKKPILYLGTGQNYSDLTKFDSKIIIDELGLA